MIDSDSEGVSDRVAGSERDGVSVSISKYVSVALMTAVLVADGVFPVAVRARDRVGGCGKVSVGEVGAAAVTVTLVPFAKVPVAVAPSRAMLSARAAKTLKCIRFENVEQRLQQLTIELFHDGITRFGGARSPSC